MKVLTAAEMREVDRRTVELGIADEILMENAGCRVVEFLAETFAPLSQQRVVVLCGKGKNGGDGLVVARQLQTRFHPAALHIVRSEQDEDITPEMRDATIVIDALLGTGLQGPARGRSLELIREINHGFPHAKVIAVDIPSGMPSDSGRSEGEFARADYTVTFTAPKIAHVMPPNCDHIGALRVATIGSAAHLYDHVVLHQTEPSDFRALLSPRPLDSNKGRFAHVLVVGGAPGKTGAAHMAGLAALRIGAGLVTIASAKDWYAEPELMTAPLPSSYDSLAEAAKRYDVFAIGPGLGQEEPYPSMVHRAVRELDKPCVLDADALNALAGETWTASQLRVLTPHPGEMARLTGRSVADVQANRLDLSREFAATHQCTMVLKGHRTVIAFADGSAYINPIGSPALAKGGTGDILTGLIAGMLGQHAEEPKKAVLGAVYLHGLAGHLGAIQKTDRCVLATELLDYLPEAIRACAPDFSYR